MIDRFNLYYAEKCSALPNQGDRNGHLTNETKMLSGASRDEVTDYILRFSHYRSSWRVEPVNILEGLCAHYPQIFGREISAIVSSIECAEVEA
jgi:hypothetical protein